MKGNIDLLTGMAIFFCIIMLAFIFTLISGDIKTSLFSSPQINASAPTKALITSGNGFFNGWDTVIAFAYIFICMGAVITSALTESNAFFAIFSIILLPVEIVFSFGFHDVFFQIVSQSTPFGQFVTTYPFIYTTFQYLPVVTLVMSIIIIIATFSK